MEKLNTKAGATATSLTLVGGALAGLTGMAAKGGWFGTLGATFKLLSKIPGPLAVIGGLITAGAVAWDAFHVSAEEALETAQNLQEQLDADFGAGTRYDQLINSQETLNTLEQKELDLLEAKKALREAEAQAAEQEAFDKWQQEFGEDKIFGQSDKIKLVEGLDTISGLTLGITNGQLAVSDFNEALGNVLSNMTPIVDEMTAWTDKGYELDESNQKLVNGYNALIQLWQDGKEGTVDAYTEIGVAMTEIGKAMGMSEEEAIERSGELVDALMKTGEESPDVEITDNAEEAREHVISFIEELNKIPSSKSVDIKVTGGNIPGHAGGTTNAPGGPTLVNEEGPELISANGQAYIAGSGEPTITNLPKGAIVLNAKDTQEALKGQRLSKQIPAYARGGPGFAMQRPSEHRGHEGSYDAGISDKYSGNAGEQSIKDYYTGAKDNRFTDEQLRRMGAWTAGIVTGELSGESGGTLPPSITTSSGSGSGGGGGSTGPTEAEIKEQNKLFKEQIDLLKHKLFLMEKEGATDEERIEQIKKIQEEIEKQKQWYYDAGLDENSKYIQDLEKQWWEFEDELKDIYRDQSETYELLFSVVSDKAQDEIDALEAQKQAIQDENSELQKQVELEKALDELAKAKQQKKLVFKDGRMQYVQDVDAVSAAQARVDELQKQEEADKRISEIDDKIKEWQAIQEQWGGLSDKFSEAQDLAKLKEKFGIDFSSGDWMSTLKGLQEYADEYNALRVLAGDKEIDFNVGETSLPTNSAIPAMAMASGEASLWQAGAPRPSEMMANLGKSLKASAQGTTISIQNFAPNLPGVSDGEGFVDYLRKNFLQQTLQFAT